MHDLARTVNIRGNLFFHSASNVGRSQSALSCSSIPPPSSSSPRAGTTPSPTSSSSPAVSPNNDTEVAAEFFFEDKPLRISEGSLDFGVVALALLGLLTFFPVCVK